MTTIKVKGDTAFAAFARQLQNNWRIKHGIPIETYRNVKGEKIQLGNYIEHKFAFKTGKNFLSSNILNIVINTLTSQENGAKLRKLDCLPIFFLSNHYLLICSENFLIIEPLQHDSFVTCFQTEYLKLTI
jgi:hypothetical protein